MPYKPYVVYIYIPGSDSWQCQRIGMSLIQTLPVWYRLRIFYPNRNPTPTRERPTICVYNTMICRSYTTMHYDMSITAPRLPLLEGPTGTNPKDSNVPGGSFRRLYATLNRLSFSLRSFLLHALLLLSRYSSLRQCSPHLPSPTACLSFCFSGTGEGKERGGTQGGVVGDGDRDGGAEGDGDRGGLFHHTRSAPYTS